MIISCYVGCNASCYIIWKQILVKKRISYHTMSVEGKASLRNLGMLCNDSFEKPVQVVLHEGESFI